jgi:hypothetical protein
LICLSKKLNGEPLSKYLKEEEARNLAKIINETMK